LKILLTFFLTVFSTHICFGQKISITGEVKSAGSPLPAATLQLKDAASQQLIAFASSSNDGRYLLEAELKDNTQLYLIASYIGLKRDTLKINWNEQQPDLPLSHTFNLTEDARQLDEIQIKAETPIVTSVNDTTKYNVARLTTADDRNIESVIRKMPGMNVSKDGTIYFNQQRITKVLLEGDDMTGENYKTITQNLKPQLVEEVQAIENYVEDDLMNGIISSDEVVLNLKVRNKKSISGSVDAGYGTRDRNDVSTNLVSFVDRIKAFTFLNNNNTGKYQDDLLNLSNTKAPAGQRKLINHSIEDTNPFDNNQFRLNNSLSGSLSVISRVNDNLKLTLGLYGIRNKLYDQRIDNSLFYTADTIRTTDQENRKSNSKNYQLEWSADQRLNTHSRLTASFSYTSKPERYLSDDLSSFNNNSQDVVNQDQDDSWKNFNGQLKYVWKLDATTAMVATAKAGTEQLKQSYQAISALYSGIPVFEGAGKLLQQASTRLNTGQLDLQGLKRSGYNYFYLNMGLNLQRNEISSALFAGEGPAPQMLNDGFQNNDHTATSEAYLAGKYTFDNKVIRLQALLKGSFSHMEVYGRDSSFIYLQPELTLAAKLNESQNVTVLYNMENTTAGNLDYYRNKILTDVRNVNSGLNQLYYFNTHNFQVAYNNNTFANDYFSFRISGKASYSPFGFLTTNFFDNTLYYSQRSLYKGIRSFAGNTVLQKFIPVISTNVTLELGVSKNSYYAAVEQQVNPYSAINKSFDLNASTGFKLPVNFSAQFRYLRNVIFLLDNKINQTESYKYSAVSRAKVGNFVHVLSCDLYKLSGNNYTIMNTELLYQPGKSRIKYGISANNIFNVKYFVNNYVSNVSESTSSTSLLGRYMMLNITLSIGSGV
jgi:hypothetical protein